MAVRLVDLVLSAFRASNLSKMVSYRMLKISEHLKQMRMLLHCRVVWCLFTVESSLGEKILTEAA